MKTIEKQILDKINSYRPALRGGRHHFASLINRNESNENCLFVYIKESPTVSLTEEELVYLIKNSDLNAKNIDGFIPLSKAFNYYSALPFKKEHWNCLIENSLIEEINKKNVKTHPLSFILFCVKKEDKNYYLEKVIRQMNSKKLDRIINNYQKFTAYKEIKSMLDPVITKLEIEKRLKTAEMGKLNKI